MSAVLARLLAVRMLIGFVAAMGAVLLGVILIRRMRALVDEEFAGEPRHQPRTMIAQLEHGAVLPQKISSK